MECNLQFISQFPVFSSPNPPYIPEKKQNSPLLPFFLCLCLFFLPHYIHLIEEVKPTYLKHLPAQLFCCFVVFRIYPEWLHRVLSRHPLKQCWGLMGWVGWVGCYVEFLMWMCDSVNGLAIEQSKCKDWVHQLLHNSPITLISGNCILVLNRLWVESSDSWLE